MRFYLMFINLPSFFQEIRGAGSPENPQSITVEVSNVDEVLLGVAVTFGCEGFLVPAVKKNIIFHMWCGMERPYFTSNQTRK